MPRPKEGRCMFFGCRSTFLILLVACVAATSGDARELRVCSDPNNLPFSNRDLDGFENKIINVIARELHVDATYTWWPQRRGFIRNTLKAGLCDLIPGTVSGLGMVQT